MKWKKYTIETTTAAEDFMSSMLMELGIEGIEIEDNIPLTKEDQADMFIDFLPELPPDEGISHVSFYIEDDGSDQSDMLRKVKLGLEDLRDTVDVGSGVISSSETEDLDWINNWKKYFSSFTIGDILIKPTWEDVKPEDADKFMIEIDHGKKLIVDAMSSFGGVPLDVEELGIDFMISSANKCIQGVPGFGFIIARKSELQYCKGVSKSLSLDIYDQWDAMEKGHGKWRFTSPTHVVRAFKQAME